MNPAEWLQIGLYGGVLLALVAPLGAHMARVYQGERNALSAVMEPVECMLYRLCGVDPAAGMNWRAYAVSMLVFNLAGVLAVFALLRLQNVLPLNPQALPAVPPDTAFNIAASFTTNTNWQGYAGESTLGYLAQMLALTVQNFASAATGMAVLAAFIRGFARHGADALGNFWVDLVRGTLYILLPLSVLLALALAAEGVVQTLGPSATAALLQPSGPAAGTQTIALGPAASQIAIKQLGTNGGGFFGANAAHPFENPTPLANFLELLAILLIPAALCATFGRMVGDARQGRAVLAAMLIVFFAMLAAALWSEQAGNPLWPPQDVSMVAGEEQSGGNMEGKETRIGAANSALWAVATTAASNGSVNAMHDSLMPVAGLAAMWLMQLGEVVFGGVGSGLYGMLAFVIVAVFVAGLMVGRTPEYLGKKIEAFEMKMASLIILIPPILTLLGTAVAVVAPDGVAGIANPGPHGFSEALYAFSSAANNNGSAFAGLNASTVFYNTGLGVVMLAARYWLAVPALAIAGSLARKKAVPASAGTLPTHTPLFIGWLIGVIVIVGALSHLPALALGPIAEQLMLPR